ncbi:4-oxalocrotonate tautomerase [Fulvimarina pelagi HTCC2506]|uniref:4-oxalocrotonate tautomerase n=2 Tax=Fulvimarina pelagi TaxID=217511 RepID=Q0G0E6_9HYPH|nr:tautomerase PptA [Fulvimarina pelagi]EAU40647.1 4-oxalocrotonate tautomerase [Fulvimarina pelagi HTCC2506]BAT31192.1 4-oxalocrotonate tautomerase [Fulvimarina pelagi]
MPHVTIKHFPIDLDDERKEILSNEITATIMKVFGSREGAVSIALEAVEKDRWKSEVYEPDIQRCPTFLLKKPDY